MSKRIRVKERLQALVEIKDIMTAMKNLSLLEIAKLTRVLATQKQTVMSTEEVISDFLSFNQPPAFSDKGEGKLTIYLLVGSERGFCGDFNERLIERLEQVLARSNETIPGSLILVGNRLASKMPDDPRVSLVAAGPSAPEEIAEVISGILKWLG